MKFTWSLDNVCFVIAYFLFLEKNHPVILVKCTVQWSIYPVSVVGHNFTTLYENLKMPCRFFSVHITAFRVASLEQLSLAEFSSGSVWPKVYENGHKNVLGIWINLERKVKYSTILVFKVIVLCQKSDKYFNFLFYYYWRI